MKLLLDEMHAPSVAIALVEESWDVVAVAGNAALRGAADEDLLVHAAVSERVLVTENVVDFMELARRWAMEGRPHAGILLTSPKRFDRARLSYPGDLIAALRGRLREPPPALASGTSAVWWL